MRSLGVALMGFGLFGLLARSATAAPADPSPESSQPSGRAYDGPTSVGEHSTEDQAPVEDEDPDADRSLDSGGPAVVRGSSAGEAMGPVESVSTPDPSAPPPARHKLVYKNLFALRYNPLGLVDELTLGWRMQLFERPGALYKDSYIGVKAHAFINPAFSRIGPLLEVQPLAVLNLSAGYDYVGYYGTFDQLQSFPTPTADYSDETLDVIGESGDNFATTGHLVTLGALLQGQVWKIAVRDNVKFLYANMRVRDGDTVFYDQTLDILEPNDGWAVVNDLDVLLLFDFGLKIAGRHTVTHAFYRRDHFLPGEPSSSPNGPTHRLGPGFLYTFYDRPDRRFNRPTLLLLAQWWLRHRWRTGADVHAAVPYLVLGFLFEGDLLPDPRSRKGKGKRKRR